MYPEKLFGIYAVFKINIKKLTKNYIKLIFLLLGNY